jgi:energy-converting hydrogenase Eha subunit C
METSVPSSEPPSDTSAPAGPPHTRGVPLALAMFTAPWGFVVANSAYAWATRAGGSDSTGADALALAAAHPGLYRLGSVAAMLASLLMVPAVLGVKRLVVARSPKLGSIGAALTAGGYICYFAIASSGFVDIAMAERGGPVADYAAVLDSSQSDPAVLWMFLLFVAGNLIGTLLLGLALLRSRAIPLGAAAAVLAWPPLHVIGLVVGSEWFEVAGAVLQAVGLAVAGRRLLAAPR